MTVFDSSSRHKRHAPRDDEGSLPPANESGQRDGVRARIVGVDDVGTPRLQAFGNFLRGTQVPIASGAYRGHREPGGAGPPQEGRIRWGDDERFVTCVSLGPGEEIHLPLAAPPGLSHVDVKDSQRHTLKFALRSRSSNAELWINRGPQPVEIRVVRYGRDGNRLAARRGSLILANVRQRLTRDDAQLALRLVARGSHSDLALAEETLRQHGLDALLDDPRLAEALVDSRQAAHASLPLFAYVVVRNALQQVQEHDRGISDYVASIVVHFAMRDDAHRISGADDEVYDTVAALLADVDHGDATRRFFVRAHLGNYALWLGGLFPDHVEARRCRRGGPDLEYYDEMGQRGFALAAQHRLAKQFGLESLFEAAAERFPRIRSALNNVSDKFLFPGRESPDRLLRQVSAEARWRVAS